MKIKEKIKLSIRIGLTSVFKLILYKLKLKTGFFKLVLPVGVWQKKILCHDQVSIFKIPSKNLLNSHSLPNELNDVLNNQWQYFGNDKYEFINWKKSPLTNKTAPNVHWSNYSDFDSELGDIKWFYEGSRFEWIYVLGRAYVITEDEKYLEKINYLLSDWFNNFPPQTGIVWRCAQECGIRVVALLWLSSLYKHYNIRDKSQFINEAIFVFTNRIEKTLDYSLAQQNNHTLCETLILYLVGESFPSYYKSSSWKKKGEKLFLDQVGKQFYKGGFYK